MSRCRVIAACAMVACVCPAAHGLEAFPGAEGFGAATVGGRGGQVIKVTNLNAAGPGSLQAACSAAGPRTVVFEVSGVIRGDIYIQNPYITLAGQTAPGAGITIEGMLTCPGNGAGMGTHDIVVRHLRLRPRRRIGDTGDAVQMVGSGAHSIIIDHCSMSWAVDETIDLIHARDVTVQWCTIEESDTEGHDQGRHNMGLLAAYDGTGNVSIHHNLWAHHGSRVPAVTPYEPDQPADFRNNFVYNVNTAFTPAGHGMYQESPINLVGNWYGRGPNNIGVGSDEAGMDYPLAPFAMETESGEIHISGNYIDGWGYVGDPRDWDWGQVPVWIPYNRKGVKLDAPADVAAVTTQTALEAYEAVLAEAGCWPRDRVTRWTVNDVRTRAGQWGRNAPLAPADEWFLAGLTVGVAPLDTDDDGMPDDWELAHGLDPANPADRNAIVPPGASPDDRHMGYTYVEYYINELSDTLVPEPATMALLALGAGLALRRRR